LEAQGVDFEFIDFRQTPIDRQTLQSFIDGVGWDKRTPALLRNQLMA
jgi:arsenate reductase